MEKAVFERLLRDHFDDVRGQRRELHAMRDKAGQIRRRQRVDALDGQRVDRAQFPDDVRHDDARVAVEVMAGLTEVGRFGAQVEAAQHFLRERFGQFAQVQTTRARRQLSQRATQRSSAASSPIC